MVKRSAGVWGGVVAEKADLLDCGWTELLHFLESSCLLWLHQVKLMVTATPLPTSFHSCSERDVTAVDHEAFRWWKMVDKMQPHFHQPRPNHSEMMLSYFFCFPFSQFACIFILVSSARAQRKKLDPGGQT